MLLAARGFGQCFEWCGWDVIAGSCHPTGAIKAACPIGHTHAFYCRFSTGFGGVNKFAFTDINADVTEGATHRVEKHKIARLKVCLVNTLSRCGLLFCLSRQDQPNSLFVHGLDKTAAVKAGLAAVPPRR